MSHTAGGKPEKKGLFAADSAREKSAAPGSNDVALRLVEGESTTVRAMNAGIEAGIPAAVWLPIDALRRWEKNPRKNDGKPVDEVMASIERFGFVAPIVVWTSADRMVAGHTRLKAMRALMMKNPTFTPKGAPGPGLVKVAFHEFANEGEANAYGIADNALGELAKWDDIVLGDLLKEMRTQDVDLSTGTGLSDKELMKLLEDPTFGAVGEDEQGKLDRVPMTTCPKCGHEYEKSSS